VAGVGLLLARDRRKKGAVKASPLTLNSDINIRRSDFLEIGSAAPQEAAAQNPLSYLLTLVKSGEGIVVYSSAYILDRRPVMGGPKSTQQMAARRKRARNITVFRVFARLLTGFCGSWIWMISRRFPALLEAS
jgi:hypothetical protein